MTFESAPPPTIPADELLGRRVKGELRKRMRALRHTTPQSACAERSRAIVERLLAHEAMQHARKVALFWPIEERHEVDLRSLDDALRARGVELFYPAMHVLPERRSVRETPMTFRRVDHPEVLEHGDYGFHEPPPDAPEPDRLDVVVVPALAIDPRGHRIGYGAGLYDATLPRFAPPAQTIGVAYDFQLLAEVPVMPSDFALGWVVTDRRSLRADAGE